MAGDRDNRTSFWSRLVEIAKDAVAPPAGAGGEASGARTDDEEASPQAQRRRSAGGAAKDPKAKPAGKGAPKPSKPRKPAKAAKAARRPATDAGKVIPFPRPGPRLVPAPAPQPKPPAVPDQPPPRPKSEPTAPESPAPPERKGWFARLKDGMSRTSTALSDNIQTIFARRRLDADTLQQLEDVLIQADLGVDMAMRITGHIAEGRYDSGITPEEVRTVLAGEVARVLEPVARPLEIDPSHRPHVILVVGVNGVGKTTTIGKLAYQFASAGRSVVLAAGDTFRAAAIDQLKIWGERTGATVVARAVGADAAGLAFDALEQARAAGADILMIDTAGRLQNKADLMAELGKVVRVVRKLDPTAPHSVLLVLDATTGQNAMAQAEAFRDITGVTGIIMTKLDGTARGGILVAIADKLALPVHAIGVGEGVDDLQPFSAAEFAAAIAGQTAAGAAAP